MADALNVNPSALREAASALSNVSSGFGGPGSVLSAASGPLSGLDVASACSQVADSIDRQAKGLGEKVTTFADNLTSAAKAYEKGDQESADKIKFDEPGKEEGEQKGSEDPPQPTDPNYDPVTVEELREIVPELSQAKAEEMVGPLNEAMREGGMNTPQRQAAFLSQIAVESDRFNTYEEYADGSDYEGREDLGNTQPGDGTKYKGRGVIQITGRYNYTQMSEDLGVDFVNHPELAATPDYAFKSAVWYWNNHDGNAVADGGNITDITRMVNGGTNNLAERTDYYNRGLQVLSR
ncbi:glycoside hydrolase family 19 protein [Mycobacterium sp. 48b]|uniref:glycoside hydrolase family 19 protein n=1 Tax=Mycobacterium sp. 48b TaxID=3400426 RepID=UPI003AAAD3AE